MISSTFKTLKENPKLFLYYFLSIIVVVAVIAVFVVIAITQSVASDSMIINDNPLQFFTLYLGFMGLYFIILLGYAFVVMPTLGNYVYEMCKGKVEPGWFKRGLKRGWWKVFVIGLIYMAVFFVLYIFFAIFIFIFAMIGASGSSIAAIVFAVFFGIIGFAAVMGLSIYYLLAYTSIMAEDDFGTGLKNAFTIGSKYFFKQLGVLFLFAIPMFLFSLISSFASIGGGMFAFSVLYWVLYAIFMLFNMFAYLFYLTYSMKQYLHHKEILEQKKANRLETPQQST